jgi:two-component system CheB/CheR fusion protein
MSGAGSDGTLGVRAIKDHGGLALAEHMAPDRASEGFVSMPQSAWATGVVDFSVPAHDMPEHITNYAAYLRDLLDSRGVEKAESEASNEELQSSKEETQSINDALDRKVAQLNQLDDDLNNLLEATDLATIFLDGDMRIKWFAPAARRIFRLIQTDVGRPITDITAGFDATGLTDELHDVLTSHGTRERPITLPNDGQTYTMRIRPYWSSGGEVNGVIMTFQDITGLTNATHRQQLLVAALQHRVRNILSTVRSLARESRETSDDLDTFFERFDGRLTALATSESIVTRSGDGRVDLAELVHEAMPDALVDGAAFNVSGDSVMLGARTAQMIALALNELATNAIKFGALGEAHGTVDLSWTTRSRGGETWLHLVWHETGIAATGEQPGAHGFGLDLVENGIPYELGGTGTVRFEPGALTCTLEVPIDRGHGDGITIANGSAPE